MLYITNNISISYSRPKQVCLRNCKCPSSHLHTPSRQLLFATFSEHCSFTRQSLPNKVAVTLKNVFQPFLLQCHDKHWQNVHFQQCFKRTHVRDTLIYLYRLTFETISVIVASKERLTPTITQVAMAISNADLALPIPVALVTEPHACRSGWGWSQSL